MLVDSDLFPLDDRMRSAVLLRSASRDWEATDQTNAHALMGSVVKTLRGPIAYCILPRVCLIGFKYAQPFLISRTIGFADAPSQSNNIGWGLTGAFAFVFLGLALSNSFYYYLTSRFITSLRGTLVTMVYAKTVDLSITALDESVALTLMATDTETICNGFKNLHELWAVPIEICLALFLIQRELKIAFVAPAAVALREYFQVCRSRQKREADTGQSLWLVFLVWHATLAKPRRYGCTVFRPALIPPL